MKNKKFSLVEIIVTIVVLSILLAIVMVNFFDMKKKTITASMSQNISIMQGMVDSYYIKNEKYPIANENALSLEKPQLIEVDMLVAGSFQKKDLDISKIKEQYYWVDVFGKVWGSTVNKIDSVSLIEGDKNEFNLEALVDKKYYGYKVYEANGYSLSSNGFQQLEASGDKSKKYYKEVSEFEVDSNKEVVVSHSFTGKGSTYLFSFIDEYGLETAPVGKSYNPTTFSPLINMEGEYEFEIEGAETMYWIDFRVLEDKPGKSTIEYFFTVKDENGDYLEEWTTDYFSLYPSKGIKVKVVMKGDDEGNKPSLYDLHVVFKYADDLKTPVIPKNPEPNKPESFTCPQSTIKSSFGTYQSSMKADQEGLMVYDFYVQEFESLDDVFIPTVNFGNNIKYTVLSEKFYISEDNSTYVEYVNQEVSGKCMIVVYEVKILGVKYDAVDKTSLCGTGGSHSYNSNNNKQIVYSLYLEKGEYLTKINKPLVPSKWILQSLSIEMSHQGGEYQKLKSITEVKDESCINIVYKYTGLGGFPPAPPVETCSGESCAPQKCEENCVPVCKVDCGEKPKEPSWCETNPTASGCVPYCLKVEGNCVPPVCTDNCSHKPPTDPDPKDKDLQDPEWTTVDTIKFFGHGAVGQLTRWYKAEHMDTVTNTVSSESISTSEGNNTRIVYRYAKSSGSNWSGEYADFSETGHATRVAAKAYIQVRTSELNNILESDYPTINMMKFYNEKGVLDLSLVQPTVVILANKDNNIGREVFSDESNVEWSFEAADPRNKEIVEFEWGGDIRDKYPVGKYQVTLRVKNEVAYWSELTIFEFEVLPEKPVANIDFTSTGFQLDSVFKWYSSKSFDPDGDMIRKVEWENNKSQYQKGVQIVKLRVQDSEGYWSDWVEKTITVSENSYKIYRLEAEVADDFQVLGRNNDLVYGDIYSGGSATSVSQSSSGYQKTFNFHGTGVDILIVGDASTAYYHLNGGEQVKLESGLNSIRSLQEGDHSIKVMAYNGVAILDYVDVYSPKDETTIVAKDYKIFANGSETMARNNEFSGILNQSIKMYYTQDKDASVVIDVLNEKGQVVRVISKTEAKGGTYRNQFTVWDGKNDKGEHLPSGVYNIRFKTKGVHSSSNEFSFPVLLKNVEPSYRLEGEDNSEQVTGRNNNLQYGDHYSGGIATTVSQSSSGYQKTFHFNGTGADVMIVGDASKAYYHLDGGDRIKLVSGLNSIKNLPEGNHTIKIMAYNGIAILDYVDIYSPKDETKAVATSYKVTVGSLELSTLNNEFSSILGQSIKLNYTQNQNATVKIEVVDSSNKVVLLLKNEKQLGGSHGHHTISWDGIMANGEVAPNGDYNIRMTFTGIFGTVTSFNFNVKLSNLKPSYRLEGEENSDKVTGRNNALQYGDQYSAGMATTVSQSSNGYQKTFHFNGTGVDIMIVGDASKAYYHLDGGTRIKLESGLNSIRGLSKASHSVKVMAYNGSAILDYVDIYE